MASPEEIAIRDLLLSKGVTDPATTAQGAIVRVIPTTLDVRFVAASPRFTTLALSLSAIGDTTVVAAQSGSPIRVRKLFLSAAGALALTIKDGGGAMLGGVLNLALGVPLVLPLDGEPWFSTPASSALVFNLSLGLATGGVMTWSTN